MENKSTIQLVDRNSVFITGVNKVISFTPSYFDLDTTMGSLTIRGRNLEMSNLTLEKKELSITGTIDSIVYDGSKAKQKEESILKKLFK